MNKKEKLRVESEVVIILKNVKTREKRILKTKNLVTDEGDKYYAQKISGEAPSYEFINGGLKLGSDNTPPSKLDTDVKAYLSGTYKQVYTGYPRTNDPDPNNTGSGVKVVTWKYFYDTNEANYLNIYEFAIVDAETANAALCRSVPDPANGFSKSSTETMTIFVNHTMKGV